MMPLPSSPWWVEGDASRRQVRIKQAFIMCQMVDWSASSDWWSVSFQKNWVGRLPQRQKNCLAIDGVRGPYIPDDSQEGWTYPIHLYNNSSEQFHLTTLTLMWEGSESLQGMHVIQQQATSHDANCFLFNLQVSLKNITIFTHKLDNNVFASISLPFLTLQFLYSVITDMVC